MPEEKPKGERHTSLEELLKDYALCTVGGEHLFYIGKERPKPGLPAEEIAKGLRMSTDPGMGFCPEHYAKMGVNQRHKDPDSGKPTYPDYDLAALELWQQLDSTAAEAELAALGMQGIRVLNYQFVVFKGDKKQAMPAQVIAFPSGKYNAHQKRIILQMLLGEQQQQEVNAEALVTLENRAKLGFELRNGPAFINGLLAAMNVNDYRLNPEDKTEIAYSGKDYTAVEVNGETASAVAKRREAAEAGIREIDRRIEAHMVMQLDALIKRAVRDPETARELSEGLAKYFGVVH